MPIRIRTCLLLALAVLLGPQDAQAGQRPPARLAQTGGTVIAFDTTLGTIQVKLFVKEAPQTTAAILAQVRSGFYRGTVFHRVIPGFMIQGGGLDASLTEKTAGPAVPNEAHSGLKNRRGTVALARTMDPHSGRAQFYVNLVDNANLDHRDRSPAGWGYCVFGEVILGLDVVDAIARVPTATRGPHANVPVTDVVIRRAWVVR
jgi:peptidyl-prolyl cis-trans isomerase B (cyclophilin B)